MNRNWVLGIGIGAALITSCSSETTPPVAPPTGGGTVQHGAAKALYVANGDADSLTRIDLEDGTSSEIPLGKEPSRIARYEGRVYTTLRNERTILVHEDDGTNLLEIARIATGAEPYGIVATKEKIFVAASVAGVVQEYDADTFEPLRNWRIGGEPRWLALHPSNRSIFVGSTYGGVLTRIDLTTGASRQVPVPGVEGFDSFTGQPFTMTNRITGDMAFSNDGSMLFVPGLKINNETPIRDVDASDPNSTDETCLPTEPNVGSNGGGGATGEPTKEEDAAPPTEPGMAPPSPDGEAPDSRGSPPPPDGCGGVGGGGYDGQKFNPVVDLMPVEPSTGEIDTNRMQESIQIAAFSQVFDSAGSIVSANMIASYPSAVVIVDDGKYAVAALEGSSAVVAFPVALEGFGGGSGATRSSRGQANSDALSMPVGPGGGVSGFFSSRPTIVVKTSAGPRGLAAIEGRLYIHSFLDRRIDEIDVDRIDFAFESLFSGNTPFSELQAQNSRSISSKRLDVEIEEGRRLFFAADNPMMSTPGAAVSCATCHFDGRTDGISWKFQRGLRQTPNLAADIAHATPVGWDGTVQTIADEGFSTSQRLMGGQGLEARHAQQIERFVLSLRQIDSPNRNSNDPAVQRGSAVFAAKGCASCHSGAAFTDNRQYAMLGLTVVKTRPLIGIAATAPFFHDGSSPSLEDVVTRASRGEMGAPFTITAGEKEDLLAFLGAL